MRWELLFGDLEAQLHAAAAGELATEVQQRTRHAQGQLTLGQRLRGAAGGVLTIGLDGMPGPQRGVLAGVGPDWLLLTGPGSGAEVLLPLTAVAWVQGLGRTADVTEPGRVWTRLGLRSALRGVARDRAAVTVRSRGADAVTGTLDRVGADHLDIAVHHLDEARRADAVRGVRTVAFAALLAVHRA